MGMDIINLILGEFFLSRILIMGEGELILKEIQQQSSGMISTTELNISGEAVEPNKPNKPNKHKNKCYLCKKKLKMIYFTCKCKHHFCIIHQNPHAHSCLYNYKKEKVKEIEKKNPKLETKLVKI